MNLTSPHILKVQKGPSINNTVSPAPSFTANFGEHRLHCWLTDPMKFPGGEKTSISYQTKLCSHCYTYKLSSLTKTKTYLQTAREAARVAGKWTAQVNDFVFGIVLQLHLKTSKSSETLPRTAVWRLFSREYLLPHGVFYRILIVCFKATESYTIQ